MGGAVRKGTGEARELLLCNLCGSRTGQVLGEAQLLWEVNQHNRVRRPR